MKVTSKNYKRSQEKILANLSFRDLQRQKRAFIKFLEAQDRKDFTEDLEALFSAILVSLPVIVSKKAKQVLQAGYNSGKKIDSKKTQDFKINWGLRNDEATIYINNLKDLHLSQNAGSISRTTRLGIIDIINEGVRDGISYTEMGNQIRKKDPMIFSKSRAELIAVQEVGRAYEYGNYLPMKELKNKGEQMKKRWITAGDERVRPNHQQNEGDGWIDLDLTFTGTGTKIAPAGFRCRCATIYEIL